MENTITDYDLDDYFRELSTKYKSREVQISRYLKNKISDNKKVVQKNIDIAISQILLFKITMSLMKDWLVTFMLI